MSIFFTALIAFVAGYFIGRRKPSLGSAGSGNAPGNPLEKQK